MRCKTVKERILKNTTPQENGCWLWNLYKNKEGYGSIKVDGFVQLVHRESYKAFCGPIPDSLCVCHSCDNPSCCNPDHLWLGTVAENNTDKVKKNRQSLVGQKPGMAHTLAKLTDTDVVYIRQQQISQAKLAEQFGVTQSLISNIKARKLWKHIL